MQRLRKKMVRWVRCPRLAGTNYHGWRFRVPLWDRIPHRRVSHLYAFTSGHCVSLPTPARCWIGYRAGEERNGLSQVAFQRSITLFGLSFQCHGLPVYVLPSATRKCMYMHVVSPSNPDVTPLILIDRDAGFGRAFPSGVPQGTISNSPHYSPPQHERHLTRHPRVHLDQTQLTMDRPNDSQLPPPPEDQIDEQPIKVVPPTYRTLYLILYNFVSALLWSVILGRVLLITALYGFPSVHSGVADFTRWTQTLAALEILHAAVGTFPTSSPPPPSPTLTQSPARVRYRPSTCPNHDHGDASGLPLPPRLAHRLLLPRHGLPVPGVHFHAAGVVRDGSGAVLVLRCQPCLRRSASLADVGAV